MDQYLNSSRSSGDGLHSDLVDEIVVVLISRLLARGGLQYEGFRHLKEHVGRFVVQQKPIQLVLPAFPCKSVSSSKCLGRAPDMAEWLALKAIVGAIRDLEEIYTHGVALTIFSDYHTFADYISVDVAEHYSYRQGLTSMVEALGAEACVRIESLQNLSEFEGIDESDYMRRLREAFGDPAYASSLQNLIDTDNQVHDKYLALKSFMEDDQQDLLANVGKAKRRQRLSEIAKGMLVQGEALDELIRKKYPDSIRLSIHDHPMASGKFSVQLYPDPCFKTPWHNCAVFDAADGRYRINKRSCAIGRADSEGAVLLDVFHQGQLWMLLQLRSLNADHQKLLSQCSVVLERKDCGLTVDAHGCGLPVSAIPKGQLDELLKTFGTVLLRGFARFEKPEELEEWYRERGDPLPWSFGVTHRVRPHEASHPGPRSSVTSEEALPIHWDMVSPPPYMNIDQSVYAYEDYIPREFVLYCHRNGVVSGHGLSTQVDSSLAALRLPGGLRRDLRATVLGYRTGLSYFGGVERQYPVIHDCQWTRQPLLRWWEVWDERSQPGATQHNHSRVVESAGRFNDMDALERELRDMALNEACYFQLSFQEGDVMLVNNWTMLHGRTAFEGERELWRIQLQAPSRNSPWRRPPDLVQSAPAVESVQ